MSTCILAVFQTKICGITSSQGATEAIAAGADAIGLNFYPESPRYAASLDPSEIVEIASDVQRIGVYVNADPERILQTSSQFGLTAIQLHGDEPPEFLSNLPDLPVLRVRRLDNRGVTAIAEDLAACEAVGRLPDAVLIDAHLPSQYGGTGETVSWAGLVGYRKWLGNIPLIVAGGLTPDNVAEAIRIVRPYGVDTASGVESSPGEKDPSKMQAFIENAKAAFRLIASEQM